MSGSTPVYGLPYPDGGDTLEDALTTLPQSLAEQVESTIAGFGGIASPGSWQAPSFGSGYASLGGALQPVGYRKVGVEVILRGAVAVSGSHSAGENIFFLPSGYRPVAAEVFVVAGTPGGVRIDILADGGVNIPEHTPLTGQYISLSGIRFTVD